jgi:hypothetical protein
MKRRRPDSDFRVNIASCYRFPFIRNEKGILFKSGAVPAAVILIAPSTSPRGGSRQRFEQHSVTEALASFILGLVSPLEEIKRGFGKAVQGGGKPEDLPVTRSFRGKSQNPWLHGFQRCRVEIM